MVFSSYFEILLIHIYTQVLYNVMNVGRKIELQIKRERNIDLKRERERETYVLFSQGINKLRKDVSFDNSFCQVIIVVGQSAEGEGSCLLDCGHNVQKERSKKGHNSSILKSLNVLGPAGQLCYGLYKSSSSLLILLKHCKKDGEYLVVWLYM